MSVIGSVEALMSESGLREIYESTFEDFKMLYGKTFLCMCVLRSLVKEYMYQLLVVEQLTRYVDINSLLECINKQSKTTNCELIAL